MSAQGTESACSVHGVHKQYGGVHALRGVDITIKAGAVHAIVGENGAGKSTLMKIMAGAERPDSGQVRVGGVDVRLGNVVHAQQHGVTIVFQELSLYPDLDVLSNLFMPVLPQRRGLVARRHMRLQAADTLRQLGVSVELDRAVGGLPLDIQQLVEIARALLGRARVVILDEPNSALNATESERVFQVVRELRDRGVAVVYVSHRLEEVMAISDVITVMRNGVVVQEVVPQTSTIPDLIAAMIGERPHEIEPRAQDQRTFTGAPLRIEGLSVKGRISDASLEARPGEILGVAGLEESGTEAVFDVLFGLASPEAGIVELPDGKGAPANPVAAVRKGIARVPADRRTAGLMLERSVADNLSSVAICALKRAPVVVRRSHLLERAYARGRELSITMRSPAAAVTQLSGGNQQKVLLAKWLEADPRIFILDDPTRGVDVGAKAEIHQLVQAIADKGGIVLFSSTDLREYELLCQRVIVFYRGSVVGELAGPDVTEQQLLAAVNTGMVSSEAA